MRIFLFHVEQGRLLRCVAMDRCARQFHVERQSWPEILWCRRWDLRSAAGKGKKERWTEDYARPQRHLSPRVAGWRAAEGEGSGVRTEQER